MVQMQPHLTLTLEALGPKGVVLPLEQKVRLHLRLVQSNESTDPSCRKYAFAAAS